MSESRLREGLELDTEYKEGDWVLIVHNEHRFIRRIFHLWLPGNESVIRAVTKNKCYFSSGKWVNTFPYPCIKRFATDKEILMEALS